MSAPGNSVILLVLLSVFVGCAGYAVGRWHERREGGAEREEAYRDGYDHAARSVFSLAARVAGPRRRGAVRASAAVRKEERATRSGDAGVVESRTGDPAPVAATPTAPESPDVVPPVADAVSPAPPAAGSSFGFPAPEPHTGPGLPAPAAAGGVNYSSLPDPHWPAEPESSGRHTVPDELVRAATYKLAADRVARAKVRSAEEPTVPSLDPGKRPPVPRPRGH
ncbi:hypothetical protein [Actinoplanes regularis]|uniref:Uncharacterized protein n=1 Tax=Actinoplanes regularis TaxID=52697 RepID=A0A238URL0_9ACTN|nr:hypothetical protein [Actinoplanes regularis]GIE84500.1 hypothetical protein Are01nite_09800 [Actinoplanes regularis]SNR24752.1 hypothetical protein SAMN06264365_10178 [Actinoplanes regularis]